MLRLPHAGLLCGALLFLALSQTPEAAPLPPGDSQFVLHHAGRARSYLLHVPPQAAQGKALPLLIAFHGGGSSAAQMEKHYRIDRVADRFGYLVSYPNGTGLLRKIGLSWNAGQCCGYALEHHVDDVGFTAAMIDDITKRFPIDPHRVFAAGHSNGAMMAHRVAIELGNRITAIAAVAGSLVYDARRRTAPRPVLVIHSVDDPLALYQGGEGRRRLLTGRRSHHEPIENTLKWWAENNGCTGARLSGQVLEQVHSGVKFTGQKIEYANCLKGGKLIFWKLSGTGHAWPGQDPVLPERIMGPYISVIDANEEIFSFFNGMRP